MQLNSGHDVFALPHAEGYIVYAPLAGRIVHANNACLRQLKRYLETGDAGAVDEVVAERLGGLEWLKQSISPAPQPIDRPFAPSAVTLFMTTRCNLRCTYCYAQAGDFQPQDIQAPIYRAAIDLAAHHAAEKKQVLRVGFHGGGEPTLAWDALTGAVEYSRKVAPPGTDVNFGVSTNGVMPEEKAHYIATEIRNATLSFDGPPEIQDVQRPDINQGGSFDEVMRFISIMREHEAPVVVRCTVTARTVDRMPELVDWFAENTHCELVHFEPVFPRGRGAETPDTIPSHLDFAEGFIAALDRAREKDVKVRYSAARLLGTYTSFCGCSQDPLNVNPDGDVTACFEVCERTNPLADTFFFAKFDINSGEFIIDWPRLHRLRGLTVHNKPLCQRCFAKWNCSGDCPVKSPLQVIDFESSSPRCEMNQEITRGLLVRALDKSACMYV